MKKFLSIILTMCLFLTFAACGNSIKSETGITSIVPEDLSSKIFYSGVNHGSFKLKIKCSKEYDENSIRVVIEDDSIIDVAYKYVDSIGFDGIKFDVNCLKDGSTSFYFETIDSIIKSEPIEITVQKNVSAITFNETEDIELYYWETEKNIYFDYESEHYVSEIEDVFSFVSENPDIATFEYDTESWVEHGILTAVNPGETYIYIQTKDGSVKSDKLKVIVPEEDFKVEYYEEETTQDNSRTVYTTPYGEKYHYSQSCAGKNASPTTENSVKGFYDPCKKCAR